MLHVVCHMSCCVCYGCLQMARRATIRTRWNAARRSTGHCAICRTRRAARAKGTLCIPFVDMRVPRLATSVRNLTLWGPRCRAYQGKCCPKSSHCKDGECSSLPDHGRRFRRPCCPLYGAHFGPLVYVGSAKGSSSCVLGLHVGNIGKQSSTIVEIRSNVGIVHT